MGRVFFYRGFWMGLEGNHEGCPYGLVGLGFLNLKTGLFAGEGGSGGSEGFFGLLAVDVSPVPGLEAHALSVVFRKRLLKAVHGSVFEQPLVGWSILKAVLEVCVWLASVSDVNGIASMVFAVSGRGAVFGGDGFTPFTLYLAVEEFSLAGNAAVAGYGH